MFTMMNLARLAVGLQGVGIAERATQQAIEYARERKQGRRAIAPIIGYPDVKRMLLTMRAFTRAARNICYATGVAIDRAHRAGDEAERKAADERAALLTPIAKAFSTDIGIEVASLGVQVHGGMGFIEETGAAQHLRDARIAAIYEGTNGIQALDLVTPQDFRCPTAPRCAAIIAELRRTVDAVNASNDPAFGCTGARLAEALDSLERATDVAARRRSARTPTPRSPVRRPICGCSATPPAAACWPSEALAALRLSDGEPAVAHRASRASLRRTSRCRRAGLERPITEGADSVNTADAALSAAA